MSSRFLAFLSVLFLFACQPTKISSPFYSYAETIPRLEGNTLSWSNQVQELDKSYHLLVQVIQDTLSNRTGILHLPPLLKRKIAYPDMALIPGGLFSMGSYNGDRDEIPVRQVSLDSFLLARYEITFAEYDLFCDDTDRAKPDDKSWGRGDRPAVYISWMDAIAYCNWLSVQHNFTPAYLIQGSKVQANWEANGYRLPTEAEWEYAAKAGAQETEWMGTSSVNELADFANYVGPNDGHQWTAPVGSYKSNPFGLYDMSGNVWEWCWDYWRTSYPAGTQVQPKGPRQGLFRVTRGGSWDSNPASLRCSNRNGISAGHRDLFIGFRLCRSGQE